MLRRWSPRRYGRAARGTRTAAGELELGGALLPRPQRRVLQQRRRSVYVHVDLRSLGCWVGGGGLRLRAFLASDSRGFVVGRI